MKNVIYLLLFIICFSCNSKQEKPKIIYVNSYHEGYAPSDEVAEGIKSNLPEAEYELQIYYMDTKRNGAEEFAINKATEIHEIIKNEDPTAIIVSDDAAVKYLVAPYLNGGDIPVIFCGVNWSADQYQLSKENVTGMLEVLPLYELLSILKAQLPQANKLAVLSENSLSEVNNKVLLDTLFKNAGFEPSYVLVNTFEEWKTAYDSLSKVTDIIYTPTNGAISNWNKEEAMVFVKEHASIPVVTCDDFMMDYAVFGLTKVAKEQGEWAAEAVKQILSGKEIAGISITKNVQSKAWLNEYLSNKIGFELPDTWKDKTIVVHKNL